MDSSSDGPNGGDLGDVCRSGRAPDTGEPATGGRVVVVGPCASGKSTLVAGLRSLGYQAKVCGQEHSEIPTLWQRSAPDVLIALDVDLATVRRRRGANWPEPVFWSQRRRLANAMAAADLVLDASNLTESAVLARVLRTLDGAGLLPRAATRHPVEPESR